MTLTGKTTAGRLRTRLLLAALAVAAAAPAALAAEPRGPLFDNRKLQSAINGLSGLVDTDQFVADLIEGETFSATVTAARRSLLLPIIELIDPDGNVIATGRTIRRGKGSVLRGIAITRTGRYGVRVSGATAETEGDYKVAFKMRGPKLQRVPRTPIAGTPIPLTFEAAGGSLLNLTVLWGRRDAPVQILSIQAPSGEVVPRNTVPLIERRTKLQYRKLPLGAETGTYTLTLGVDTSLDPEAAARFRASIKVDPARLKSRQPNLVFQATDPFLPPRETPFEGDETDERPLTGRNFSQTPFPTVFIGENQATVLSVSPDQASMTVIVPPGPAGGTVSVTVVNPDEQFATAENYFRYAARITVSDVEVTGGRFLPPNQIPLSGGADTLHVTGTEFNRLQSVRLGSQNLTPTNVTATEFDVTFSSPFPGMRDLTLIDDLGRSTTFANAAHFVGFVDTTSVRSPAPSAVDDLSAFTGVIGDVDGDSRTDDLILTTYNGVRPPYADTVANDNSIGSRTQLTRFLAGDNSSSLLTDRTSARIPINPQGRDWNGRAVALGDLDGNGTQEILVAGHRAPDSPTPIYPTLVVFDRGGSGTGSFSHVAAYAGGTPNLPEFRAKSELTTEIEIEIEGGGTRTETVPVYFVIEEAINPFGGANAIAVGDLDGDGDDDIMLGHDGTSSRYIAYDIADVDLTQTPPYILSGDLQAIGITYLYSSTRVIENRIDEALGLVDVTNTKMPSRGTSTTMPELPSFQARDIELGDIDGDDDLDAILTWHNPNTVLPSGLANYEGFFSGTTYVYLGGSGTDPQTCTRVLTNDGDGNFTDATASWMPAASSPEFWQGHRVELADLDNDDDLDLLLLHRGDVARFLTNSTTFDLHSLRILRNDGPATGFTDVTTAALPALAMDNDDTYRGTALAVTDINGDGFLDLVVGTSEELADSMGFGIGSTRLLLGGDGLVFTRFDEFLPATDTGEASEILIGDFENVDGPSLILLNEGVPRTSTLGRQLRFFDWSE